MNLETTINAAFGRGIVLGPHQTVPSEFSQCPAFKVDDKALVAPDELVSALHAHWANRRPVVIHLAVDAALLKGAVNETDERAPWQVGPSFLLTHSRLHFLVWNNNTDMRSGQPIWWWARKAVALGATECQGGGGDVTLDDGTAAYCDGGPLATPMQGDANIIPYAAIDEGTLRVTRYGASAAELAPDQLSAVHHGVGPARVIAPAGSGKTRVLTERLRYLLADCNVSPNTVMAVAYNTRAAGELNERTAGLNTHIRTLNSLALALVNGTGPFLRSHLEPRQREMLDERAVRNILQKMVELPRKMNTDPLAAWIEALSTTRLGLKSPHAVEESSGDLVGFADVFDRYRLYLKDNAVLDFDEQIYRSIEILLQDPEARAIAQRQCRTLLVDEFQDLTPAHLLMLRLLASPALNVFGVGDDDQVIYGYAGADPSFLVNFDKWFPGASHHALEINYRCPAEVVAAVSNMLTRNPVRVAKHIEAGPTNSLEARSLDIELTDDAAMASRALGVVTAWTNAGVDPSQIAILARVNVALLAIQVLLSESGIAHTAPVNSSLLDRTGIRTALAYLRIASDPDNIMSADILETVRRPSRKIARNVVDVMIRDRRTSLKSLRRTAAHLSGNDGPRVDQYIQDIQSVVRAMARGTTADALEAIRSEVGLGEAMDVLDGSRKEADRSTHGDDLAAITAVAHLHDDVNTFEPWLRDVLNRAGGLGGVELSTVHRVKGREWDNVIVYDASAGLMPHRLSTDRAEERRVLHVALTRGRNNVTVLADNQRPSPFLAEFAQPGTADIVTAPANGPAKAPAKKGPRLAAGLGMTLGIGGTDGEVVEITDSAVILGVGRARTAVPFGATVSYQGKSLELGPPRNEAAERILNALKEWRRSTAAATGAPAYTVLHDAHLEGIAQAVPNTLSTLGQCNGIGPAKLERWGDEILAIVAAASDG